MKVRSIIIATIAFVVGILPGFFIVFNSVFSDSSGAIGERILTYVLTVLSYLILGAILGFFGRDKTVVFPLALSAPAIIILVLYSLKETGLISLNLVYGFLTMISAWGGTLFGFNLSE